VRCESLDASERHRQATTTERHNDRLEVCPRKLVDATRLHPPFEAEGAHQTCPHLIAAPHAQGGRRADALRSTRPPAARLRLAFDQVALGAIA
jgi:hypothetical protein